MGIRFDILIPFYLYGFLYIKFHIGLDTTHGENTFTLTTNPFLFYLVTVLIFQFEVYKPGIFNVKLTSPLLVTVIPSGNGLTNG